MIKEGDKVKLTKRPMGGLRRDDVIRLLEANGYVVSNITECDSVGGKDGNTHQCCKECPGQIWGNECLGNVEGGTSYLLIEADNNRWVGRMSPKA